MKKSTLILLGFILLKFTLEYVLINPVYELQRDEYLHLDQANHLAWGFHSVPPFTSWISLIIKWLSNGVFWVKFFPSLFGALTIYVVWKTVETLKGDLFAFVLASSALLFSVLLRLNLLYQPNSFDILSWTLVYFCLVNYFQNHQSKWLYYLAISFALGFLNKYNIAFCIIGLFPALLLSKHRKLFLQKHFYFALGLAILLILPNVLWQINNGFPVLKHMKELAETQLVHVNRMDFVKEQLLFFIGSIFVIIASFSAFFIYKPFKNFRFLFWAFVFTIIAFIYFKAKGYYAIGLYPIFIAFGSVYLAKLFNQRLIFLRWISLGVVILMAYPVIVKSMPIYTPAQYAEQKSLHTWEDGKKHPISQDFADMLGWKELAHKVDSIYSVLPNKQNVMILCDNYGQAGAINYYHKVNGVVGNCFNTDYENWVDLSKEIKTVIRIKTVQNLESTRDLRLFNVVKNLAEIETPYAREKGTRIILLDNPKLDLAKLLREERAKGNLH